MKHVVVLSGAGISAESGLKTFRDSNGLWEEHRVEDVATPEAFARNPELVLRFYNLRRAQLKTAKPNVGHRLVAALEEDYRVTVITQNVDDLHERGGSTEVVHLHGELTKVRPVDSTEGVRSWDGDLLLGDLDDTGTQLRPHIVWFGEDVPLIEQAALTVQTADAVIIVGTSLQVYPAAGLLGFAPAPAPVVYIDPAPSVGYELRGREQLHVLEMGGSEGMERARELLARLL
ncbi:NAD-dependent protein deacylase sirtuin-5, mitochondrial [Neolewinella maritima]|uniref:NAD-dependent protein deacylase n=1 Tax=Neolewinella maritima TaxID=1383882 RepID=A0ABM9B0Y4_9BACT|nr:Sir2 family NAD-dependent protein deacetylase [Neolewinella maritima]CAH1000801.1 NAD-dependent protein deacylase sirtuin-5, mitochondrial [Neolewinella maritima]